MAFTLCHLYTNIWLNDEKSVALYKTKSYLFLLPPQRKPQLINNVHFIQIGCVNERLNLRQLT